MAVNVDDLDLAELASRLAEAFRESPPEGNVPGRTALRDVATRELDCSTAKAEEIVDTMVEWKMLGFEEDAAWVGSGDGVWRIRTAA